MSNKKIIKYTRVLFVLSVIINLLGFELPWGSQIETFFKKNTAQFINSLATTNQKNNTQEDKKNKTPQPSSPENNNSKKLLNKERGDISQKENNLDKNISNKENKHTTNNVVEEENSKKKENNKNIIGPFKLIKIIDGDTIKIGDKDGTEINVRFIGIDAPESQKIRYGYIECFGKKSTNFVKKLIGNQEKVHIETDPTQGKYDKYNRLLGYILIKKAGKTININKQLIKEGYAWEYTYNKPYKYRQEFMALEQQATNNNKGLWNPNTCNGKRVKATTKEPEKVDVTNKEVKKKIEYDGNENDFKECSYYQKLENPKYCYNIKTCEEALYLFKKCGFDRLDSDGDGVPCENVCKKNKK